MGVAGAIIGGGALGAVGQVIAGGQAAKAAQGAAMAQLAEQRATRREALQYAAPGVEEIKALEVQHTANMKDLERKEKLLSSVDPALIEAGKQALGLLRGEEVRSLEPIRRSREQQREQLKQRLRDQLGAGYETSTAGMQALSRFDQATDETLFQAQESRLGQLLGVAQNVQGLASVSTNIQNLLGEAGQRGAIKQRQVSALTGTPITEAGAPFTRAALQAQNIGQAIGGLGQAIGSGFTLQSVLGSSGGKTSV